MTVCIAAITENRVIGASDRMLTSENIEFEPERSKITVLTTSILIMRAGDSSLQDEIIQNVYTEVINRIKIESTYLWAVKDVAALYAKYFKQAKSTKAENEILAPLGLTHETFITRQREMDSQLIEKITNGLLYVEISPVQSIIAGIDETGAHIYISNNGQVACQDSVGFASIGIGEGHANSQLMFAGHHPIKPVPETVWNVFSSKKRSEVAPGVGKSTDMFIVGPQLGTSNLVPDEILQGLERIYENTIKKQQDETNEAKEETGKFLNEIVKKISSSQSAPPPQANP